ncbi:hypothetical protein F7725_002756 [Dissostichus mawsoni]|uniref:PCI domain-containing protein n=1 Tax=Dissostichus mawsoni TaxID=36200 RepID=A0A7J5YBG8_DISMA|nr:hypothetical protein F7725_002756 [Dissostichus mawsoni]
MHRSLAKSSPFFAPIKEVVTQALEEAGKEDDANGAGQPNPHYCETLVEIILHYGGTVPLWTGLMLKDLGKTRDSNAVVENWFRTTEKVILSSKLHRRAGDFLQLQQEVVVRRLKGVAIMKKQVHPSKTYAEDKRQSEVPETLPLSQEETWRKRNFGNIQADVDKWANESLKVLPCKRYEPAAVTYHLGPANHFVAFHKLGLDRSWHFYDGLEENQKPGRGDTVIKETTIQRKLGANSRVGHIVMVRQRNRKWAGLGVGVDEWVGEPPLLTCWCSSWSGCWQGSVEPMQIDADPQDDQQNAPDTNYIDLEQYATSYSGLMRIERLQFIAEHCPQLRVEALKMALTFVQRTFNVDTYEEIHRKLTEATREVQGVPDTVPEGGSTRKKALLKLEKLDTDLKNYKGNSIKESISNALKCYSRARDYCTSAKHVINMCLNVIKNWSHVLSYVNKAESTPEIAEASFDHCDCPELLSPSNVAVYGGMCALATFDRQELQRNVISSSSFKLFLELEPQIRDIIFKFYESKYASCLKLLDEMKDNLLLDMYLAPHVKTLYSQIRNRALIQPYVSADMTKMAQAFNTTVAALEDELTQLILEGLINARIDSHSKILYARDVDQRSTTFEKSIHMGKEFQRRAKAMILRAAVLRNQIHSPPREGSQGELTPANSQTRMSTNMLTHPFIHTNPQPRPLPVSLLKTQYKDLNVLKGSLISCQLINPLSGCSSGGLDKRKVCFDEAQHVRCV